MDSHSKNTSITYVSIGCVCAIAALGLALRAYNLGGQSYWEEELFSLDFYARLNPVQIVQEVIANGDPQPPLYYILLHLWTNLVGRGEFAVRFLSLVPGVLTIPLVYLFAKQLYGRREGVAAAVLAAVNPFQVWYSQEARTYTLTAMLTLLSTICLFRLFGSKNWKRWLVVYVVATNLAIFSHYFTFFVIAAQDIGIGLCYLAWRGGRQGSAPPFLSPLSPGRIARRIVVAQLLVLVPYLPWAPFAARIVGTFPGWHEPISAFEMLAIPFRAFNLGITIDGDLATWLAIASAIAVAAGILLGALRGLRQGQETAGGLGTLFGLAYFFLPFAAIAIFITYTGRVIFHERYFIVATPALFAFTARAMVWSSPLRISPARVSRVLLSIFVALLTVSTAALSLYNYYYLPKFQKADFRSAMSDAADSARDGDVILSTRGSGFLIVEHYRQVTMPSHWLLGGKPFDKAEAEAELGDLLRKYKRIWLIPTAGGDVDPFVESWLDQHTYRVSHRWYAKGRMLLYVVGEDPQYVALSKPVDFGDQVELSRVALAPPTVQAGSTVSAVVDWKQLKGFAGGLSATIDLVDRLGHDYGRLQRSTIDLKGDPGALATDGRNGSAQQKMGLPIPYGTPPGTYSLEARVYQDGNPRGLTAIDATGNPIGAKATVGSIQVVAPPQLPAAAVDPPNRVEKSLASNLKLIGHDLSPVTLNVGQQFSVTLFWQALERIGVDLTPVIELKSDGGRTVGRFASPPARGLYPTSGWARGEVVRDIRPLAVPRDVDTGQHSVSLHLENDSGSGVGTEIVLGKINVIGRSRIWAAPPMAHTTDVEFGSVARLLGYDLDKGTDASGSNYALITLYWRATGPTSENYKAFVHLLDDKDRIVAQGDAPPANGLAPTSGWIASEIIADQHKIPLPSPTPGLFRLRLGLYDESTMTRLPATKAGASVPDQAPVFDLPDTYR